MKSRILSRLFATKGIFAPPVSREKRPHPHVECLESRIAPASISLTTTGGGHADFDLGSGSSYSLDVAHGKLQVFDSAHQLLWSHRSANVLDLSIDAGADAFTLSGPLHVGDNFNLIGSGALTVNGLVSANHEIDIQGGFVSVTGSLVAQNGKVGGEIVVTGDNVALLGQAKIDASGAKAGGTVLIGGDFQGGNAAVKDAQKVLVEPGVKIAANATRRGPGGKVILFADDALQFTGNVSARGGALGGQGGFVETSADVVQLLGGVKVSAAKGQAQGTWLVDPNNLRIGQGGDFHITSGTGFFDTNGDDAFLSVASLDAALNAGGNVFLTTKTNGANTQEGRIEIWDTVTKSSGADSTLTFNAHTSVEFVNDGDTDAPALISTSGKLNIQVNTNYDNDGSGGGFYMLYDSSNNIAATINTNGGNFSTNTAVGPTDKGVFLDHGTITTGAGNITITGTGKSATSGTASIGIDISNNSSLTTTSGNITLAGTGGTSGTAFTMGVSLFNGSTITTATGAISVTGSTTATGASAYGVKIQSNSSITATGNGTIAITGTGSASGSGSSNDGVALFDNADVNAGGSGSIMITGVAGANSNGLNTGSGSNDITIGGGAATGAITIAANSISLGSSTIQTTSTVTLRPNTIGTAIDVGSTGGPTAGTLELSDAELDQVNAGTLQIGDSNSGAITVSAAISRPTLGDVKLVTGSTITVNSSIDTLSVVDVTATTGSISLLAAGDINLNAPLRTGSAFGGSNLTVVTGSISLTSTGGAVMGDGSGQLITGDASGTNNFLGNSNATSGSITVTAAGAIQLAAAGALTTGLATTDDGTDFSATGSITLTGTKVSSDGATGAVDVEQGFFLTGGTGTKGVVTATTTGGAGNAGGFFIASGTSLILGAISAGNATATSAADLTVNGTITANGLTTLNAPTINLYADVAHAVTGSVASIVNVAAPGQIQDGIDVAGTGATVNVAAGTYTLTSAVSVYKSVTLRGAEWGVDAQTRWRGAGDGGGCERTERFPLDSFCRASERDGSGHRRFYHSGSPWQPGFGRHLSRGGIERHDRPEQHHPEQ